METNEGGQRNAMHHPDLDCRSGGKTAIEDLVGTKRKF